jgi:hypothetical protein
MKFPDDNPEERQARKLGHAAWRKTNDADTLHDHRVEQVRRYLQNPRLFPDGLDWPYWKQLHELWYTGYEDYWDPLALALQAEIDAKAGRVAPAPVMPVTAVTKTPESTLTTTLTRSLTTPASGLTETLTNPSSLTTIPNQSNKPFDKKAYQRDYMRQRRSTAKATQFDLPPSCPAGVGASFCQPPPSPSGALAVCTGPDLKN